MKILYVAGLAHCGSTYLSRILNRHSSIFSTGEITDLHEQVEHEFEYCSCQVGEEVLESPCPFWVKVTNRLQTECDVEFDDIARVSLNRQIEWIRALKGYLTGRGFPDFKQGNRNLFRVIREETGCSVVLDASKSPWRLLPLARSFPEQIRILHLVKAPTNQMASKVNRGFGFYRSALMKYLRKNVLIHRLFSDTDRYLRVKFEDFIQSPDGVLHRLFDWVGVDFEDPFHSEPGLYHHLCGSNARTHDDLPSPDPGRLKDHGEQFGPVQRFVLSCLQGVYGR